MKSDRLNETSAKQFFGISCIKWATHSAKGNVLGNFSRIYLKQFPYKYFQLYLQLSFNSIQCHIKAKALKTAVQGPAPWWKRGPKLLHLNILDIKHKCWKLCIKGTLKNHDFGGKNMNKSCDGTPFLPLALAPSMSLDGSDSDLITNLYYWRTIILFLYLKIVTIIFFILKQTGRLTHLPPSLCAAAETKHCSRHRFLTGGP